MKSRRNTLAALAVVATGVLTGCGVSAPPAAELAFEVIDTLDVSDSVKDCMRLVVADFQLTDDQAVGFDGLDDVASKAADGNAQAQNIMDDFEADLAACN